MAAEEAYTMPESWAAVCKFFDQAIAQSKSEQKAPKKASRTFHGTKVPHISITGYITRIHKYAKCSESCLVIAFIYIQRLLKRNAEMTLNELNAHRYATC
eukprot:TRINITY_DN7964_c0_g1_i12.p2 TRINITY_DN7964_c0_g1~~TRINITY_DN7964_c0_g1_i12.p2  ORF type:complete len:100 (+),score=20.26 TRINITY_DN7964_c0_g1_i12:232-531(+)